MFEIYDGRGKGISKSEVGEKAVHEHSVFSPTSRSLSYYSPSNVQKKVTAPYFHYTTLSGVNDKST
ncbi:hypothetical protein [Veronia pacifica]|uniref:hypothetical protein n=1 Tax=Veronia pacifica TaxID=1080227 RepID=UPI0015867B23|nr:hypothetical protein [Veronia pacifica]